MAETVRTLATILDNLGDGEDNTAEDVRDAILSSYILLPDHPSALDAEDIYWQGDAAGMTTVTVTGSQTLTERVGRLSALFSGQASNDYNCLLRARTFSIGDSFAVPVDLMAYTATNVNAGIIFTDGTASTSNGIAAALSWVAGEGTCRVYTRAGTLTNFATLSTLRAMKPMSHLWMRLTYQAANTWRKQVSIDGVSWSTLGIADASSTLTPTHVGVVWSVDGGATEGAASFGPILKLA